MRCNECKHFNTTELYDAGAGWCDIELPNWLYQAAKLDRYEVVTTVRPDDSCDLGETKC